MEKVTTRFSRLFVLSLSLVALNSVALGDSDLKANLDLPFEAAGAVAENEEAPEIIVLYGSTYEADAVVFCLDGSVSMRTAQRWELQRREITRAISELSSNTEFGLVFYGESAYAFREKLVKATELNKIAAVSFLASRPLTLGTCLGSGLIKSLAVIQGAESNQKAVIISGDGRPTQCPFVPGGREEPQIIQRILDETATANAGIDARIHTIFVGTDGDTDGISLMRSLSQSHNGTFQRVVSAESATSGDRSEEVIISSLAFQGLVAVPRYIGP